MVTSSRHGVRGCGTAFALEDDVMVHLGGATLASAARANPNACGDALDRTAQADLLVQ
jgi:hypothetical protein